MIVIGVGGAVVVVGCCKRIDWRRPSPIRRPCMRQPILSHPLCPLRAFAPSWFCCSLPSGLSKPKVLIQGGGVCFLAAHCGNCLVRENDLSRQREAANNPVGKNLGGVQQ